MRQTVQPRILVQGNNASKPLAEKSVGVEVAGETPSLTGKLVGETHGVIEHTQANPPRNQHQKGPICLGVKEEVTETHKRAGFHCFLSGPSPTYKTTAQPHELPCAREHLRLHPLLCNRHSETQKCGPNKRTDQSSRKNTTKQ